MKKYSFGNDKSKIYIGFIYFLIACAILANFIQMIGLRYKFGEFHFFETIIIMFNDSYTGFYTFPFLLSFILMLQSPVKQNIFFAITRYSNRKIYYRNEQKKALFNTLFYIMSICIFSTIVGLGNSILGNSISLATQKFSNMYLLGDLESNILFFEVIKTIILQGLLLCFFTQIFMFLIQFKIPQALVFIIYSTILIFMAAITLGFFGEFLRPFSLFTIASSVYDYNLNFVIRMMIILSIDMFLFMLNFKIFENKDIVLPKGNKQYQNE